MSAKKHMNNSIKDVGKVKSRKQATNVLQGFACNLVVFHTRTQLGKKSMKMRCKYTKNLESK